MTRPRPILKRAASPSNDVSSNPLPFATCQGVSSPHVHFPPTPRMSSMHTVYSPQTYDRAPIAISPNACQLPDRGSRKLQSPPANFEVERRGRSRTRSSSISSTADEEVKGSYFHPRAYEACKLEPSNVSYTTFDISAQPVLVDDLSPSDESDTSIVTPPDRDTPVIVTSRAHSRLLDTHHRQSKDAPHSSMHSRQYSAKPSGEIRTHRPSLGRNETKALDKAISVLHVGTDEGCLGGF